MGAFPLLMMRVRKGVGEFSKLKLYCIHQRAEWDGISNGPGSEQRERAFYCFGISQDEYSSCVGGFIRVLD